MHEMLNEDHQRYKCHGANADQIMSRMSHEWMADRAWPCCQSDGNEQLCQARHNHDQRVSFKTLFRADAKVLASSRTYSSPTAKKPWSTPNDRQKRVVLSVYSCVCVSGKTIKNGNKPVPGKRQKRHEQSSQKAKLNHPEKSGADFLLEAPD